MKNTPHQFSPIQISNWSNVPLWAVVKIGNATCSGVDFQGSSKRDIYRWFLNPITGKTDPMKFEKLMDGASLQFKSTNEENKRWIGLAIEALKKVEESSRNH